MGRTGAVGGGKSTIVSLLERFYDVTGGEILVDGVNIKKLDPEWYRYVQWHSHDNHLSRS